MSAFYPFREGGRQKRTLSAFFTSLSRMMASLSESCLGDLIEQSGCLVSTLFKVCLCFWIVLLSLYHAILDGISDSGPEKQL